MKGLELGRGFFGDECLPRLRREMPGVMPYIAAGLAGEGSDCFGYDDFLSRDHDWGPAFCIWLPERLMAEYAEPLEAILGSMPEKYGGYKARKLVGNMRVGLHSIEYFYRGLIGCGGVPQSAEEWLSAPEHGLAAAVNGEVFLDNLGEFSAIRQELMKHYPEDVRLWLLARRCALAAQTGQYNYLRCLQHGEKLAAEVIKGRFIENAAGAAFLLSRRYAPFYKWTYRALKQTEGIGPALVPLLEQAASLREKDAIPAIEQASAVIITELRAQNLSDSGSDFLMDHCGGLILRIKDEKLRRKTLSLDF